jgi:hypothetical protein
VKCNKQSHMQARSTICMFWRSHHQANATCSKRQDRVSLLLKLLALRHSSEETVTWSGTSSLRESEPYRKVRYFADATIDSCLPSFLHSGSSGMYASIENKSPAMTGPAKEKRVGTKGGYSSRPDRDSPRADPDYSAKIMVRPICRTRCVLN